MQKFQLKISKSGMGLTKTASFAIFGKSQKFQWFFAEFHRQFLTQCDIHSKSNLVLLPPGLWTNHRTVLYQILSELSCDWSKDDKILRALWPVDTTCWLLAVLCYFYSKAETIYVCSNSPATGICWFNRNFDLLHIFQHFDQSAVFWLVKIEYCDFIGLKYV